MFLLRSISAWQEFSIITEMKEEKNTRAKRKQKGRTRDLSAFSHILMAKRKKMRIFIFVQNLSRWFARRASAISEAFSASDKVSGRRGRSPTRTL